VTLATVEQAPLDRVLPITGTLAAKSEALIAAQVEGQVETTLVDFGARVKAGQELARIDTASYEALANQAAANLKKAQANAQNARQNLARIRELQQSHISSASELDSAVAAEAEALAEVAAIEAGENIARLNLARSIVRAPFEGAVAERIATAGDYLKIGSPLYRIVDDTELKFISHAPERNAGEVKVGQAVRFEVDAWPNEVFQGKIYLISPSISTETRSFRVGALVSNRDLRLKANTFARGEIILASQVPTPMVPLEAIVSFAGVTKVFVITDGVARSREVKLGRVHQGKQEVLAGLQPGETVAVTGQTKLYEAAKVRLTPGATSPTNDAPPRVEAPRATHAPTSGARESLSG
jgi:RND family efflux transporter MFP subunit